MASRTFKTCYVPYCKRDSEKTVTLKGRNRAKLSLCAAHYVAIRALGPITLYELVTLDAMQPAEEKGCNCGRCGLFTIEFLSAETIETEK